MLSKQRWTAKLMALVLGIGSLTLAGAKPASASSEKLWKYGTYLGALGTGAALLKNRDTWALVGAGVTALSYSQWKKSVRRRHESERRARYVSYRTVRSYRSYRSYRTSSSGYGRGYSSSRCGRGYASSRSRRGYGSSGYHRYRTVRTAYSRSSYGRRARCCR